MVQVQLIEFLMLVSIGLPGTEYSSFTEGSHMFVKTSKKVFAYQAIGSIGNSGNLQCKCGAFFCALLLMMIHHVLLIIYQMEVNWA